MIRGRNSKELILDTILTKVTCQTPVSESPNQEGVLSHIEEAAASSQLDHYEVKFEWDAIYTEDERDNHPSNNEVRCQQANIIILLVQSETPQNYDLGTVPASDWRSDMVSSMTSIFSEDRFAKGK